MLSAQPARGLTVRHLADKSKGNRTTIYDPHQGRTCLVNPETGKMEPWPSLGWVIQSKAHKFTNIPMKTALQWKDEGFAVLKNERIVHAPGGTVKEPWKVTHTFVNADAIVLRCTDGIVTYKVIHQPGKYNLNLEHTETPKGNIRSGRFEFGEKLITVEQVEKGAVSRCDWFFGCELESDTRSSLTKE